MILALVTHGYLLDDTISPLPIAPTGGQAIVDPRPKPPKGSAVITVAPPPPGP